MLKCFIFILTLFILTGCGDSLQHEANSAARVAFEEGNFRQGSLLLVAGCDDLHNQSLHLLRMLDYYQDGEIHDMIFEWLELIRQDVSEGFIRQAAMDVMSKIYIP